MTMTKSKPKDLIVTEYYRGGKVIEYLLPAITPNVLDRCMAAFMFELMKDVKSKVVKRAPKRKRKSKS